MPKAKPREKNIIPTKAKGMTKFVLCCVIVSDFINITDVYAGVNIVKKKKRGKFAGKE